jgi:hypothetical protein
MISNIPPPYQPTPLNYWFVAFTTADHKKEQTPFHILRQREQPLPGENVNPRMICGRTIDSRIVTSYYYDPVLQEIRLPLCAHCQRNAPKHNVIFR